MINVDTVIAIPAVIGCLSNRKRFRNMLLKIQLIIIIINQRKRGAQKPRGHLEQLRRIAILGYYEFSVYARTET